MCLAKLFCDLFRLGKVNHPFQLGTNKNRTNYVVKKPEQGNAQYVKNVNIAPVSKKKILTSLFTYHLPTQLFCKSTGKLECMVDTRPCVLDQDQDQYRP